MLGHFRFTPKSAIIGCASYVNTRQRNARRVNWVGQSCVGFLGNYVFASVTGAEPVWRDEDGALLAVAAS